MVPALTAILLVLAIPTGTALAQGSRMVPVTIDGEHVRLEMRVYEPTTAAPAKGDAPKTDEHTEIVDKPTEHKAETPPEVPAQAPAEKPGQLPVATDPDVCAVAARDFITRRGRKM